MKSVSLICKYPLGILSDSCERFYKIAITFLQQLSMPSLQSRQKYPLGVFLFLPSRRRMPANARLLSLVWKYFRFFFSQNLFWVALCTLYIGQLKSCGSCTSPCECFEILLFEFVLLSEAIIFMLLPCSQYFDCIYQLNHSTEMNIQNLLQLQPDKRIHNYEFSIDAVIGTGSYGVVYLGKNVQTQELVALKQVPVCNITIDQENLLAKEIDIMKSLKQENIVRLIDVLRTGNNYYIISEFCSYGDLKNFIKTSAPFSETQALLILTQILKAIQFSLNQGIIHRDLKPANILISSLNPAIFKIADFGFAKRFSNLNFDLMQSLVGTPLYMSPQVLLRYQYTSKCDVWSIGMIYYELLEGKLPWDVLDVIELINMQKLGKIKFSQKVSQLSQDFITKCICYDENTRISWEQVFSHPLFQGLLEKGSSPPIQQEIKYQVAKVNKQDYQIVRKISLNGKEGSDMKAPQEKPILENQDWEQTLISQLKYLSFLRKLESQLRRTYPREDIFILKVTFLLSKNAMIKSTLIKEEFLDNSINVNEIQDYQSVERAKALIPYKNYIINQHFATLNDFQENFLELNSKLALLIDDHDFLDHFSNNFREDRKYAEYNRTMILRFIEKYVKGYERVSDAKTVCMLHGFTAYYQQLTLGQSLKSWMAILLNMERVNPWLVDERRESNVEEVRREIKKNLEWL